jgi:hypothetical protein
VSWDVQIMPLRFLESWVLRTSFQPNRRAGTESLIEGCLYELLDEAQDACLRSGALQQGEAPGSGLRFALPCANQREKARAPRISEARVT